MAESEKWTIFRTRYTPVLWPIITYWSWPVKTILGVDQGTVLTVWQHGKLTGYREKTAMEKMASAALEILKKNIACLQEIKKVAVKCGEDAVEFTKAFASKAKSASLEEFAQFFDEFNLVYQKVGKTSFVYWIYTAPAAEAEIKKSLARYSDAEVAEIFSIMSLPVEKTYSALEEEEFEKIVELAREKGIDSKEAKRAIKDFSARYFWFPYEYVGPEVWDEETIARRVRESVAKPPHAKSVENVAEKQEQCIAKYNLSKEVVNLFKILQVMALMQDDRKMYQAHACYYLDKIIITELAQRLTLPLEQARYIDANILRRFINSGNATELKNKLKSREELMLLVQTDEKVEILEGKEAENQLKAFGLATQEDYTSVKEIKGQVANRGHTIGTARILLTPNPGAVFNEGDVLVTGMTTPAFVAYIKKASAIVTNEGGITCHAAIISRELGKPCIIGTKIATKALKNGQKIEVDAEKGIVKILS